MIENYTNQRIIKKSFIYKKTLTKMKSMMSLFVCISRTNL